MSIINSIKQTFVQQSSEDSCGPACMSMILNYIGRNTESDVLRYQDVPVGGISLLQLQRMAESYSLLSGCVEMDIEFLKGIKSPVILHTVKESGQNHFQVCYGFYKKFGTGKFLIADPAVQVHFVGEKELNEQWVSKAALYFEHLPPKQIKIHRSNLIDLWHVDDYPLALIITIPLLGICIASFGIALTWLLQKGLSDERIFDGNVIYAVIVLLLIISISKNLFTFLKQYILIRINLTTNILLTEKLVIYLISVERNIASNIKDTVRNSLISIQKVQNAVSAIISVVIADGTMVLILLAGTIYEYPQAGLICAIYIAALSIISVFHLPEILFQDERTRNLSAQTEKLLINQFTQTLENDNKTISCDAFLKFYKSNLNVARSAATAISKIYLIYECLGTFVLITTIGICVIRYKTHTMEYTSLMLVVIETFLITGLMQKICTSFQQIGAGADAWVAHSKE